MGTTGKMQYEHTDSSRNVILLSGYFNRSNRNLWETTGKSSETTLTQ